MTVLAHAGRPLAPHDLMSAWSAEPLVLVGVVVACCWYGTGLRSLWRSAGRGRVVSRWQGAGFAAAMTAIVVALISPLDALSSTLFSAHMLQHLLLTLVAAPLLVVSAPLQAMAWGLPASGRRRTGRWSGRVRRLLAAPALPGIGLAAFTLVFALWHLPVLYDAALRGDVVHGLEHATMLASAAAFWAPAVRPRRTPAGLGVVLLFASLIASGLLAALLVFSPSAWYAHPATELWGLTALRDQQLGGGLMWILGGAAYVLAGAVAVVRWLRADEEAITRRERVSAQPGGVARSTTSGSTTRM